MMAFLPAAKSSELWQGELHPLELGERKLFLARLPDGVRAYENRCPHQGVALSEGSLNGCQLTCCAHQWEFDLETGRGLNPECARLTAFSVKEENGMIYVDPERRIP
jgi:toluene monooxygenase system ferredoxin subunit